ncbi:hypothetical protein ACFPM1_03585 [Halorubrum rubrum]|uniref:Uncharacterized protein n=1 Tax=Halorubrum rubrum TaxID=1126240 RepID=A0ABD5QYY8_9EURY|nr:hypothetical protein [Halorubrum rubrum]
MSHDGWHTDGDGLSYEVQTPPAADYLSDDRICVGADGSALGYPLWTTSWFSRRRRTAIAWRSRRRRRTGSAVNAISYYEWNELLEEYFRAYDAFCPGPSFTERLADVVEAEAEVFRELFADVDTYRAAVPRSSAWHADGIDREVVDGVGSVSGGTDGT